MTQPLRQDKRAVSALAGPYGHPIHPILVTVPIGAFVCSLVFDVTTLLVDDAGVLARGSVWLIAIGVVAAAVAALFGFLDLIGVRGATRAFRTGLAHLAFVTGAVLVYLVGFLVRRPHYDGMETVAPAWLALSIVGLAMLAAGGYLGGTLAYRYGVRVADEATQDPAHRTLRSSRLDSRLD